MAALQADRILEELSRLWADLAKAGGETEGVVRACALTLIVFAEESDDPAAIAEILAHLMREQPNRAIVVRVRPGGAPLLEHQVLSQCWKPFGGREQICCERIEITASDRSLRDLAPVLTALRAPDLPVVLWYRSARVFEAVDASIFPADKLIVDSDTSEPRSIFERLAGAGPAVADLAWTRLTRWRALVAQTFEGPRCRELMPDLDRIHVLYSGNRVPARALYLAAWIVDALGRDVECRFDAVEGEPGELQGLELAAGDVRHVSIRRYGDAALIEADGSRNCTGLPRLGEAELLAEELSVSSFRDPVFTRVLRRAAGLASEVR